MYNLGTIEYVLDVDTKSGEVKLRKFDDQLKKGTKSTKQFGATAVKSGNLFKAFFASAIVAGAIKIGKHLVKMAHMLQRLRYQGPKRPTLADPNPQFDKPGEAVGFLFVF